MSATEVNRKWTEAINRHDADAFAALYAPNATVQDPQYAQPLEGRDAVRKDMAEFMIAFPDLHAEVRAVIENGSGYASEGVFRGTHTGPLVTPEGELPPSGKPLQFSGSAFYRLDAQGRILEERRYYDLAGLFAQLDVAR
jgi:steroid delta-isomerase-like uncharacterized protein